MSTISAADFTDQEVKFRVYVLGADENLLQSALVEADGTDTALAAKLGILTETVPTSDTASSGLNGRLQRLAQALGPVTNAYVIAAAGKNAQNLRATAGHLRGFSGYVGVNYPIKLCFYNTSGSPVHGTDVIYQRIVAPGRDFDFHFQGRGLAFATGIGFSAIRVSTVADIPKTAAGSDTVANDFYAEVEHSA